MGLSDMRTRTAGELARGKGEAVPVMLLLPLPWRSPRGRQRASSAPGGPSIRLPDRRRLVARDPMRRPR